MSASRRAPKPRYTITQDRDRIAMALGALCGFVVMVVSAFVQGHSLLETIFRAAAAMVIVYAVAYPVMVLVAHLRETQSIAQDASPDADIKEPETE